MRLLRPDSTVGARNDGEDMESLEQIKQLIQPILDIYHAQLVDINLIKAPGSYILRIFVDKENRITVGECAAINKEVGDLLDKDDTIIKGPYTLEVSSPGIDRPFKRKEGAG